MKNDKLKKVSAIAGLLLLVTILVFVTLINKSHSSPEEEVRNTIERMQQNVNKQKITSFMAYIADDYIDNRGFNKQKIEKELETLKIVYRDFNIKILESQIEMVSSNEARIKLKIQVTAGIRLLGQQEKFLNVEATMEKQQESWIVRRSQWELEIPQKNKGLN